MKLDLTKVADNIPVSEQDKLNIDDYIDKSDDLIKELEKKSQQETVDQVDALIKNDPKSNKV